MNQPANNGKPIRVIISGGGTGGHIFPAVAIANELKTMDAKTEILFVGAEGKMEMQKVPQAGYQIIGLPISGIRRELTLSNLAFPFKLIKSLWKARQVVKDFQPDVAVGVGGYASGPLLFAAGRSGVPTLIQEQNSYAGLTNKWLAGKASTICVAYEGMEKFFPKNKIKLTGNPVRKDIAQGKDKRPEALSFFGLSDNKKTLLVIGGSLGARTINESMEKGVSSLLEAGYQVVWQTGKGFIERASALATSLNNDSVKVFEFISVMDLAYAAADAVVSRAGALSVSELCLVGKPAILVPFPFAAEDHQTQNAMALVKRQSAILITDAEAKDKLIAAALELLGNEAKRRELSNNIRQSAKPEAARTIAEEVIRLANK
jgi:UDP-N-acetylglucosamine--N-acetylmuramyl-(pentapeptide) pyrophosphoryl-undecaprenol N-acetylglucosamine transferase